MTLYSEVDIDDYYDSVARALIKKKGSGKFPNENEIISSLKEKDLYNILKHIEIDVRFLGSDYEDRPITGKELDIPIHFINREHAWSTTKFKKLISESI